MRRLILIPAALLAVAIASVAGIGVSVGEPLTVNLSCSDGTNLDLALDTAEVTQLSDAVTAINLYPAGDPPLTCSLTQSAVTSSPTLMGIPLMRTSSASASGNPQQDYAVGGGQAAIVTDSTRDNFALSAHAPAAASGTSVRTSGGTLNLTIPPNTNPSFPAGGHLSSKPDCLEVGGNGLGSAQVTAVVTQATGVFTSLVGREIRADVLDSGVPGGTGDMIAVYGVKVPCDFRGYAATHTVDHGNINVHDAP